MKLPRVFTLLSILVLLTAGGALAAFPTDPPDDPRYAPDARCPDLRGEPASGQWNLFSDQSGCPPPLHGSGISANLAWQVTQGSPDVVIGVLDSGVDYDHEDLRDKIWLNRGELPVPTGACSAPFTDPHNCNGDGVFNVEDYAGSGVPDLNGTGDIDRGDLRVFADGLDNDGNGYVDDLSGWDSADDDGDEFDHRFFGHGTGRAGIVAPETNNGLGVAGVCPVCPMMNVRIDDTFVHTSEGVAKGAIYAIDNGAKVLNMSLGGTTASRLSRGAFTYAMANDVLAVNASANEFSTHQNFQSVFDDVMTIGAVTPDNRTSPTTWKQKANFSNYGAHLDVVGPTLVPGAAQGWDADFNPTHSGYTETASGTSSSTPHAAGVGALVYSEAIEDGISPPLSAQEVRHIINLTADDVGVGEMTPPYTPSAGWDKWSGYGRVNAKAAVDRVSPTTIPPEADINSPDWYSLVDGKVEIAAYANARRATAFDWVLEVGKGVEPTSFARIDGATAVPSQPGVSSAELLSNLKATWDVDALAEGMYTLRLRVADNLLPANQSEDRMAVWVRHEDPHDLPGFPRFLDGSLESLSVALVDLNADNDLETVFTDGNGEIHALQPNGQELPGFPVHTQPPPNLPLTTSPAFDGKQANGEVRMSYASTFAGPAVADIDGDDVQEIVASAMDGRLYCWDADGSVCEGAWPAATDHGFTRDPYGTHTQLPESHPEAITSTPALGNLDSDPALEIVAGTVEQKLYVWNADGSRLAPWPKKLSDTGVMLGRPSNIAPRAILSSAAIADMDADGANEIVVGTNETFSSPNYNGTTGGSGRVYLLEANGEIAPGWPVKPTSLAPSAVPLVAEGVGSSPAVGNIDGDPQLEVAIAVFIGDPTIYNHDGSTVRTLQGAFGTTGPGSKDFDETTPEGGLANPADQPSHFYVSQGILANIDGGGLEYVAGTVGNRLTAFVGAEAAGQGAGPPAVFDHLVSAWDATNGSPKPNFPRVVEDWQFIIGPSVADIGGGAAASPEIIQSSGGYFVHAFDRLGLEPAGWPKLTGHWQTATPSIGDLNGDGKVEVVQTTRLGAVFAWSTPGAACQSDEWRKFRHDEWNTGTYGADTRRPEVIEDLVGSRVAGKITLTWTAPGDDGPCGSAQRYEVRASSNPITTANFDQAQPVASEPKPAAAGKAESFTFEPPQGARYFAVRAIDEVGNPAPPVSAGNDPEEVAAAAEAGTPGSASGPIDGPAGPLCPDMRSVAGNHILGTASDDDLTGTTGPDVFCGLGGNDRFAAGGGDDHAEGGPGRDSLKGQSGDDALDGGGGRDTLHGGPGRDRLRGGPKADRLLGGGGADRCSRSRGDRVRSC